MTNLVFSGWDSYARKALWGPAGIAILPVVALAAYWVPDLTLVGTAASLAVSFGVTIGLAEWIRPRGRRTEARLIKAWGGLPTTRALRFRDGTDRELRKQRRRQTEAISGHTLPTKAEERSNPVAANERYTQAVYTAIARMREGGVDVGRLNSENASYGFRRNARALKWISILALLGAGAANLYFAATKGAWLTAWPISLLDLVALWFWAVVVCDGWVTEQAEIYGKRFFITAGATDARG